jgi:CubicO group peptidase (beta-lactamase class C family)
MNISCCVDCLVARSSDGSTIRRILTDICCVDCLGQPRFTTRKAVLQICGCVVLLIALNQVAKTSASQLPSAQPKSSQIDNLIEWYAANHLFNGSVLVAEKGDVLLKKGYGLANMEWNIPNATDTKFRIGSITKQFTATLVLQLMHEGKLSLQAKITECLPWYRKDKGDKVSIQNLLEHTSGIPNYTTTTVLNDITSHSYSRKEVANKFCSGDLEFEPGTKFAYDNSGYFLLGMIIEELSKKSYEENMQERIFKPLGMKDSGIESSTTVIPNRACGYEYGLEGYENAKFIKLDSATFAAGAIYSTVEDLNRWQNALCGDMLLSREYKSLMLTPKLGNYGYGLYIAKSKPAGIQHEITSIGHQGGINGFSSLLIHFVEIETTVILLDNTRAGKRGNIEDISLGICQIVNGLPSHKPKQSLQVALTEKMRTGLNGNELTALYKQIINEQREAFDLAGAEAILNNIGYHLLEQGRSKDSIAVLKLAVEEFPLAANTFDSYAEALIKEGQFELAIKSYKRSLELNPQNSNAIQKLKLLESKP